MIKQDINNINRAMRAIGRGDKELAAEYLVDAYNGTRSKQIRELVMQIRELHELRDLFYAIRHDRAQQKVVTVPGIKACNDLDAVDQRFL
jgi:hypothetical protein